MTDNAITPARLLPWASLEGKPCYLLTDGSGRLSRAADAIEKVQLGMADALLDHAADMIEDQRVTTGQLRFVLARMSEALTDVRRIAESRGARLLATQTPRPARTAAVDCAVPTESPSLPRRRFTSMGSSAGTRRSQHGAMPQPGDISRAFRTAYGVAAQHSWGRGLPRALENSTRVVSSFSITQSVPLPGVQSDPTRNTRSPDTWKRRRPA
ncbi:hypothetical protein SUDANB1_03556 [Streptomyces sp. enrichment culture]